MGILNFCKCKADKKYLIACLITIILAIICGIVLYVCNGFSVYTYNFADSYVFCVLNFKNVRLFFSHIAVDLFYFYVFFLIGYFTKYKFLSCPVLFLKWFFAINYVIILFTCFSVEGIVVAAVVFIPSLLISTAFCIIVCDFCKCLKKSIVFFFAAIMAIISTVITLLFMNILFRVLIVIV